MASSESAFTRAVEAYIAQPTKKKRASFLSNYLLTRQTVSADDVQTVLSDLEKRYSQKALRKVLRPVFQALLDYDGVLSTLASADPLPSALVWGGLKAVLECFKRYNAVFEKIESQLKKLTSELNRLASFEELYGHSEDLQSLLMSSYLHILKFWAAVEEQCATSAFLLAAKSLTSFKTRKLDDIIGDIAENSDNVAKLVPIIQERMRQGDHKDAARERHEAGIMLETLLNDSKKEQEERRLREVQRWIQGGRSLNESNDRHQHKLQKVLLQGTGQWIQTDDRWLRWLDINLEPRIFWLNGDPGSGKSVLCAYAAQSVRKLEPSCVIASQYFSFDEVESLATIYRNIAEQLFSQLYSPGEDDVSEHVYDIAQCPGNEATVGLKRLIKILTAESKSSYIFLDGFDEEHAERERWENASDVVSFFTDLANQSGSTLKLWCSTQRRAKIRGLMASAESVELTASTNGRDIETFFADALRTRHYIEMNAQSFDRVIIELKQQVNGNFLWASLMLDTIADASSIKQLQSIVEEGLPEDFENYLANRMKGTNRDQHVVLSKVLSALVYAKRPLHLEELREAISISYVDTIGQNLSEGYRVQTQKILDHCAPWIRIDTIDGRGGISQVCTLTHSSIKKFLIKTPAVLLRGQNCEISPSFLAEACLQYLEQKRYRKLLLGTDDGSFQTVSEEDIINHHFLSYCAKFWSRHLSDAPPSKDAFTRVEGFVRSKNFFTLIQLQSLFVEGQFNLQTNILPTPQGKHLIRAFPRWFTEKYDTGKQLQRHYEVAIGEWGFFLDTVSTEKNGANPGEIDRCFWGTLPKSNFLHSLPSRYKCSVLESKNAEEFEGLESFVFDSVEAGNACIRLFRTDDSEVDGRESEIIHEQWSLTPNHRPKLVQTDRIPVTVQGIRFYRAPLRYPTAGRAAEVSISDDGLIFRIGNSFFIGDQGAKYKPLETTSLGLTYVEELASNGEFFAVASRKRITPRSLVTHRNDTREGNLQKTFSARRTNSRPIESRSTTTEDEADSESSDDTDTSDSDHANDEGQPVGRQLSDDSDGIESHIEDDDEFEELADDSDDFDDSENSFGPLSAEESASDGSRSALSNDVEDEGLWNDFVSDLDDEDVEDTELDNDSQHVAAGEATNVGASGDESSDSSASSLSSIDSQTLKEEWGPSGRAYNSDLFSISSGSESEADNLVVGMLEQLIQAERKVDPTGKVSEMSVFKIDANGRSPTRVFRYWQYESGSLFSSPPAFHPRLDLVVWPISGEKLVFANYTKNRFFTRLLGEGPETVVRISVQCRFSPCGKYLHIISLDGYIGRGEIREVGTAPKLTLKLHLSTLELSRSKPERTSPRLIYQTSVGLDRVVSRSEKMTVPNLPYSFSWTPDHVYVTESSRQLKVIRISLFKDAGTEVTPLSIKKNVFKNTEPIYLPASADTRKIQFIPNEPHVGSATTSKEKVVATVILSSRNADNIGQKANLHLPQVVRLTEAQFGRWEPVETKEDDTKKLKPDGKRRRGRPSAKFEKFDKAQDRDIIPFLA